MSERDEYLQGVEEGKQYRAEKEVYGEELAEIFRAQDEHNQFWIYGED